MSHPYDDDGQQSEGDYGATTPLMSREEARRLRSEMEETGEIELQREPQRAQQQQQAAPQQHMAAPAAAAPRRGIPAWVWIIAGVFLLAVIGFVLFFVLLRNPGFT